MGREQVLVIRGCLMHSRENVSSKQSLFSNDNKSYAFTKLTTVTASNEERNGNGIQQ